MLVHVRLAEPFWRAVGQRRITVELALGARVADLLAQLCAKHPTLSQEIEEAPPLIFIGDDDGEMETVLTEGAQVHLVWPIAGG
ncbi:MAG: MoaD/ThiS family protein [Chloroflexi bacterium]|nr:MoaD/ThiS family protein [Chloroflexota bacterium]